MMDDDKLDKVIKALEHCSTDEPCWKQKFMDCPYTPRLRHDDNYNCARAMAKDALELLKEQEAKPVDLYGKEDWYGLVCVCPDCKAEWMSSKEDTHFCPKCGQAVKWE